MFGRGCSVKWEEVKEEITVQGTSAPSGLHCKSLLAVSACVTHFCHQETASAFLGNLLIQMEKLRP